jgi:hypothetical protein
MPDIIIQILAWFVLAGILMKVAVFVVLSVFLGWVTFKTWKLFHQLKTSVATKIKNLRFSTLGKW